MYNKNAAKTPSLFHLKNLTIIRGGSQCVNVMHVKLKVGVNGVVLHMYTPTSKDTVIIGYSNNYLGSNL